MSDVVCAKLDDLRETVESRFDQTEDRMSKVEVALWGDPTVRLPSGERDRGLAGKVHDHGVVVAKADTMIRVLKWVGGLFAGTIVALLGNLASGLF